MFARPQHVRPRRKWLDRLAWDDQDREVDLLDDGPGPGGDPEPGVQNLYTQVKVSVEAQQSPEERAQGIFTRMDINSDGKVTRSKQISLKNLSNNNNIK